MQESFVKVFQPNESDMTAKCYGCWQQVPVVSIESRQHRRNQRMINLCRNCANVLIQDLRTALKE